MRNTDLIASGSIDSPINLYWLDKPTNSLVKFHTITSKENDYLKGVINTIWFGPNRDIMAWSYSPEEKWGRWKVSKPNKIGIEIMKF